MAAGVELWLPPILMFAGVALIVAVYALLTSRQEKSRAHEVESAANYLRFLLDQNPSPMLAISPDDTCYCPDRLREWLNIPHNLSTVDELKVAFAALDNQGDVRRFFDRMHFLRNTGASFRLTFRPVTEQQAFLVVGERSSHVGTNFSMDIISFTDVSDISKRGRGLADMLADNTERMRLLSNILSNLDIPIWFRNTALKLEWVNPSYASAVDADLPKDAIRHQSELHGGELIHSPTQLAQEALQQGHSQNQVKNVIIKGERRAMEIHEIPLVDGLGTVGYAIDVSGQVKIRNLYRSQSRAHQETLNRLSTPIAIFRRDQTLEYFNKAFSDLWNLPLDWLSDEPKHSELLEVMHKQRKLPEQADFPAWKKSILARYTNLLEPIEEMWFLPDDSSLRVVTEPHPLGGLLLFFEDVTDRLQLERSYHTLIDVQQETLENLQEAVAVVGSDIRLKLFNSNFARIWNIPKSKLEHEPHLSSVLDLARDNFAESDETWPTLKKAIINYGVGRKPRSGHWWLKGGVVLQFSVIPLPDGAALYTILNVTDSVKIEQALKERTEALEEADRIKTDFVANMSYEIRTPLNSIVGFSSLLENKFATDMPNAALSYVQNINYAANHLNELVKDILDVAMIDAGKAKLTIERQPPIDIIKSAVKQAGPFASEKGIGIDVHAPKDMADVDMDAARIKRVLHSLLSNAISRAEAGSAVHVYVEEDKDNLQISIHDEVPKKRAEENTEFASFPKPTTGETGEITDLGMTMVKSFIALHGGNVKMVSDLEKGTKITCTLPKRHSADMKPDLKGLYESSTPFIH